MNEPAWSPMLRPRKGSWAIEADITVRTCARRTNRGGSSAVKRKKSKKEVWFIRIIAGEQAASRSQSASRA